MRPDAEHRGGGATDERAAEPAEAEAGVQSGEDRPADAGLHLDPDGVGRDVDHAGRGAEDEQRDAERRDRVDEPGQECSGRDRHRGHGADRSGAEPGAPGAGEAHADERAERQAEQGDAERAVAGAHPDGDVGHAGGPAAEDGTVEDEEGGDGGAEPGDGGRRDTGAGGPDEGADRFPGARQRGRGGHGRTSQGAERRTGKSTRPRAPVIHGDSRPRLPPLHTPLQRRECGHSPASREPQMLRQRPSVALPGWDSKTFPSVGGTSSLAIAMRCSSGPTR